MSTHFVKPKEPTVLAHKEYHELSATNLLLSSAVPTIHVIPEIVDVERFNAAVSNALSNFPLLAGKLVRPATQDLPWAIHLTNSGVPVRYIDSDADEYAPSDLSALTSFTLVERLNVLGIITTEGESDEILFQFKVTRFTKLNCTAIAACLSHVLLDGTALLMFIKCVSHFYQGLGPIDPPYHEPEAIKFPEPVNAPESILPLRDLSAAPAWQHPAMRAMGFVAMRLSASQLAEMHAPLAEGREDWRISRADVVVGLTARILTELDPESKPIDTILNVVNHRGMGIYPMNSALNSIFWLPAKYQDSKDFEPRESVLACIGEVRKSLKQLRDPEFIKDMVAGLAKTQAEITWNRQGQDLLTAMDGCLVVNNLWKLGWRKPDFGYPGKVKFLHGHPPCARHIKIIPPNPICVDGQWVTREDEMEVTFYVPPGTKEKAEELFERYAKSLGLTGSIHFF